MRTMIICICNRINEGEVRTAAQAGAATPYAVYAARGCAMRCGRCVCAMKEILADVHGAPATTDDPVLMAAE